MTKKMVKNLMLVLTMVVLCFAVSVTASAGLADDIKCAAGSHSTPKEEVVTAATCGTVGVARVYCSNCNKLLETKVIPATGVHTDIDNNGFCDYCEVKFLKFGECGENTTYTLNLETGELFVSGIGTIKCEAFYNDERIRRLTIEEGIVEIGEDAFASCDNLEYVKVGGSVNKIGKLAFYDCDALRKVILYDGVEVIGNQAFIYCENMVSILMPETIKTIESSAIKYCKSLEGVYFLGTKEEWESIDIFEENNSLSNATIYYEHKHDFYGAKGTNPTCVTDGEIWYACECGCDYMETIPATGHKTAVKKGYSPTCTKIGKTDGYYCSVCNEEFVKQEEILPLGHSVSATKWVIFEEATCTKDGVMVQLCSICKETVREAIPKLGHRNVEIIPGTPADCTLSGVQDAIKCKDCGQWLKEQVEIPALGHEWVDSGKSLAATCTTDGVDDYKCSRCPETKTGTVPATGHQNTETIPGKPADCTLSGVQDAIKCKDCGQWLKEQVEIPALGHDYSFKITATCTESGVLYYRCKRCGYCIEEAAVALGHDYIKEKEPTKESTCIGKGIWIYKCCRCGNIKEEDIPAKGHTYQLEWQTIIAPTCTETGVSIKICKDCFDIQTNTLSIIPHSDADADNKCDMCSFDMTPPQSEEPEKPSENCGCSCHKSGIAKFFFNIGLFFQKIFKKNAVCDCGVAHY